MISAVVLEIIKLTLQAWVLVLEGMSIDQRRELTQRFLDTTGPAQKRIVAFVTWAMDVLQKHDADPQPAAPPKPFARKRTHA